MTAGKETKNLLCSIAVQSIDPWGCPMVRYSEISYLLTPTVWWLMTLAQTWTRARGRLPTLPYAGSERCKPMKNLKYWDSSDAVGRGIRVGCGFQARGSSCSASNSTDNEQIRPTRRVYLHSSWLHSVTIQNLREQEPGAALLLPCRKYPTVEFSPRDGRPARRVQSRQANSVSGSSREGRRRDIFLNFPSDNQFSPFIPPTSLYAYNSNSQIPQIYIRTSSFCRPSLQEQQWYAMCRHSFR